MRIYKMKRKIIINVKRSTEKGNRLPQWTNPYLKICSEKIRETNVETSMDCNFKSRIF